MSSKYGRVTQPDKLPISTPADALEYTDEINGNGYNRNGNGIYNDPVYTVEMSSKSRREPFRIACFRCQNTKKNKFMLCGGFMMVVVALILIIVAASSHSKNKLDGPQKPQHGLIAYGPNQNGIMRFDPTDLSTYTDENERMKMAMKEYNPKRQLYDPDTFIKCHANTTTLPDSKVCMQTWLEFGDRCQSFNSYGLITGQPCVLLVLKLKGDELPVPLDTYNDHVTEDRYSNMSVGISCEGKTAADNGNLNVGGSKLEGPPIDFHPPKGFPLYYFKLRNANEKWVDPAVMVQFNDVKTQHEVTVKCTAWAQNFNDAQPQNSPLYSTEFKFDILN